MNNYVANVLVSAAVALAVGGTVTLVRRPAQQLVSTGKVLPNAWGELTQAEIDALTKILSGMPKHEVAIFCAGRGCDDLALDFDNAFESAHWVSGIEHPLVDTNVGINVGPDDESGRTLAAAIESATGGRISPGLIESHLIGGRMALVISRPRK